MIMVDRRVLFLIAFLTLLYPPREMEIRDLPDYVAYIRVSVFGTITLVVFDTIPTSTLTITLSGSCFC